MKGLQRTFQAQTTAIVLLGQERQVRDRNTRQSKRIPWACPVCQALALETNVGSLILFPEQGHDIIAKEANIRRDCQSHRVSEVALEAELAMSSCLHGTPCMLLARTFLQAPQGTPACCRVRSDTQPGSQLLSPLEPAWKQHHCT